MISSKKVELNNIFNLVNFHNVNFSMIQIDLVHMCQLCQQNKTYLWDKSGLQAVCNTWTSMWREEKMTLKSNMSGFLKIREKKMVFLHFAVLLHMLDI